MGTTYLNTPKLRAGVAEFVVAAEESARNPMPDDRGQVAVFCDEQTQNYLTRKDIFAAAFNNVSIGIARLALSRSGLSWDPYHLWDLENPSRHKYKVNVFLAAPTITQKEIQWVQENLQKDGNILVWVNAAGMCSDGGNFEDNILKLTGMRVKCELDKVGVWRIHPVGGSDSMAAGLADNMFTEMKGPLFHVDDNEAVTIGVIYGTGGKTGWAVKRFKDWTSIYIAMPGAITPELLRNIAREAGVIPVGPNGDATASGNGFLVIHALTDGSKMLQWKGPSDVFDIQANQFIARGVESLTFSMKAFKSRWFRRYPCHK